MAAARRRLLGLEGLDPHLSALETHLSALDDRFGVMETKLHQLKGQGTDRDDGDSRARTLTYPDDPAVASYLRRMDEIPGWLLLVDALIMCGFDNHQRERQITGDVLEIGAYQGKSAILMGYFRRGAERLVVCDLFMTKGSTEENTRENQRYYEGIDNAAFETNYRLFHSELPTMLATPSSSISKLEPGSFRLVHVDGSHLYEIVREDLRNTRHLLCDGGVVIIDDWRTGHTPGVAAATWEAILHEGLVPICFTDQKLYGTWTPSLGVSRADIERWNCASPSINVETLRLLDRDVHWVVDGPVPVDTFGS
jgi:hypothetical protein